MASKEWIDWFGPDADPWGEAAKAIALIYLVGTVGGLATLAVLLWAVS